MELLLAGLHLNRVGGAASYLLSVARDLGRYGHTVTLHTTVPGPALDLARTRGLRVAAAPEQLPERPDALVVQDSVMALDLAERYPGVPQVLVCHGAEVDMQVPPQVPGIVSAVVAMSERVAERLRAQAVVPEIVRLRQPIDVRHFQPRGHPRPRLRRLLFVGHRLAGERRDELGRVCEEEGIQWQQLGRHGEEVADPAPLLAEADVVVGYGRSVLEGMASGRAAYVLDYLGGDGWVTPERYPALEADGFAGDATPDVIDPERFRRDLREYRPEMGQVNYDLVVSHHRLYDHSRALSELLGRVVPEPLERDLPLREMARLVRAEYDAAFREMEVRRELAEAHARQLAAEARAGAAEEKVHAIERSARYRMGSALARPLEALRRRRTRP